MRTHLSETHLVSQNSIFAIAPEKGEPVEPCELEILQLTASSGNVFRIFVHALELRPGILGIDGALVGELALCFAAPVRSDLLFGDRIDIFLQFPCTMLIVEALPFAEVFHLGLVTSRGLSVGDDAFDIAESFEFFFFTFLVEKKGFNVLTRKTRGFEASFPLFVGLDIVIDALEAFEALEEFVGLIGIVEMRKVLPFDMKALYFILFWKLVIN